MQAFNYHRASSVPNAVRLRRHAEDARFLAGGQSLLGAMKLGLAAPTDLVDVGSVSALSGVSIEGGVLRIGAATTHAQVSMSPVVQQHIPALAHLAGLIGDPAVRSRGTLGGSIANNDPAACYPAAVLALGGRIETDRRPIEADVFFTGLYETALASDELILAVHFPVPECAGWAKFRQPASRFSMVGVFVSRSKAAVRVAATGAGPCVFRVEALEAALSRQFSAEALAGVHVSAEPLNHDMHASAAFRAHLIKVMTQRAVAQAKQPPVMASRPA